MKKVRKGERGATLVEGAIVLTVLMAAMFAPTGTIPVIGGGEVPASSTDLIAQGVNSMVCRSIFGLTRNETENYEQITDLNKIFAAYVSSDDRTFECARTKQVSVFTLVVSVHFESGGSYFGFF